MKKFFIVILILSVLIAGGFYYYKYEFQKEIKINELIPSDVVAAYSTKNIIEDLSTFRNSQLGDKLSQYDWFKELNGNFEIISKNLNNEAISATISVHKINQKDVDFLYFIKNDNVKSLKTLLDIYEKKDGLKIENRNLDGITIKEVIKDRKAVLSFAELGSWFVISKSPFLIEKVIKNKERSIDFIIEYDVVTVFGYNFQNYLKGFFNNDFLKKFSLFDNSIYKFNYTKDGGFYLINGSSIDDSDISENINIEEIIGLIPMSTSLLIQKDNKIEGVIGDNFNSVYWITKEVDKAKKVIDTLFALDNYLIYNVKDNINGIILNNMLVSSSSKRLLEEIVNNIEEENVWSKSLKIQKQLSHTVNETNFSFIINWNKALNFLASNAKNDFKSKIKNTTSWVDFFVYQSTNTGENEIVESFISLTNNSVPVTIINDDSSEVSEVEIVFEHSNKIISKPFITKNHNSGKREIVFQDSLLNVCLLSSNRNLLWEFPIDRKIKSDIFQVDIYRNGKLQYAFCTESKLYVLDRNGNLVENYPIELSNGIDNFSIFDYDKNRKYRFLINSINGNLLLLDSKGNNLEPWNPLKLHSKSVQKIVHTRIDSKDYIVTVTKDNKIHLLNRRGEEYKGFPVSINIDNVSNFIIDNQSNSTKSLLKIYSTNGDYGVLNFKGEVISKKQSIVKSSKMAIYGDENSLVLTFINDDKINVINTLDNNSFNLSHIVDRMKMYDFSKNKRSILVTTDNSYKLYSTNGNLITSFNSTSSPACIYSEAKEELVIYKTNKNKIEKLIINY